MPIDQLAHLEGCVSYRLDESITHRVGLAAYQIITNPNTIANDPDLPIYSSVDALIRKLSKNHNAPPGTSRVLPVKDLDYSFLRRLRRYVSYRINSDTLLVFDTPLVVAPMMVDPVIFDRTPSLPCLSEDIRKQLVSRFPNKLRVRQKSLLLGLPCVCRPTLTKAGLMRKSQAEAFAAARITFLWERGELLPAALMTATHATLSHVSTYFHPRPGIPEQSPTRPDSRGVTSIRVHNPGYFGARLSVGHDPTWEQEANALIQRADQFTRALKTFASPPTDPLHLRLLRARWPHILRVLSWWHPYLSWLQNGFPEPHTKFDEYATINATRTYRSLKKALFSILRTYVPAHHFTAEHHLVLHPGFASSIPHPFTLNPHYPYPSDVYDRAQHDRLSTYLGALKLNDPLPPQYPNPVPIL